MLLCKGATRGQPQRGWDRGPIKCCSCTSVSVPKQCPSQCLTATDLVSAQMTGNSCCFFPNVQMCWFFLNIELCFKNVVIWQRLQLLSIHVSRISIFEEANNSIMVCNLYIRTYSEKHVPEITKMGWTFKFHTIFLSNENILWNLKESASWKTSLWNSPELPWRPGKQNKSLDALEPSC